MYLLDGSHALLYCYWEQSNSSCMHDCRSCTDNFTASKVLQNTTHQIKFLVLQVNDNHISFFNKSNWSSIKCLWGHMSNHYSYRYSHAHNLLCTRYQLLSSIPWEAPLKRPSVTKATDFPKPAPTRAAPGLNISGIPGLNRQVEPL